MIRSFQHAGLEKFFWTGSKAGIQPAHAPRLRLMLSTLERASSVHMMNVPGWKLQGLKGELAGHYAVWVNGNWRMTFRFEGEDAYVVDYRDYH